MKKIKSLSTAFLITSALCLSIAGSAYASSSIGNGGISGTVYSDTTCNGLDLSDRPLAGAKVEIASNVLASPVYKNTDYQGNFRFTSLKAGRYSLRVLPVAGYFQPDYFQLLTVSEVSGTVAEAIVLCPQK